MYIRIALSNNCSDWLPFSISDVPVETATNRTAKEIPKAQTEEGKKIS